VTGGISLPVETKGEGADQKPKKNEPGKPNFGLPGSFSTALDCPSLFISGFYLPAGSRDGICELIFAKLEHMC
jgi:hypothetical protein